MQVLFPQSPRHPPLLNFTGDSAPETASDTHSFGVVYVNEPARNAFAMASPGFPPGAIIVREKLPSAASTTPDLIAVMIKRELGFNPKANDWEFAVINGAGNKVIHREKSGDCQQCHASQAKDDFVFRSNYQ